MPSTLIISYEPCKPSQLFKVETAIKSLGPAIKERPTLWYVKSRVTAHEAKKTIMAVMDANDTLLVVDTSNNSVVSHNVRQEIEEFVEAN